MYAYLWMRLRVACSGAGCCANSKASRRSQRFEKDPPASSGTRECVPAPMPWEPPSRAVLPSWEWWLRCVREGG
jgi:hypothetical protein